MTRPTGKLLRSDSVDTILDRKENNTMSPENTIKYKIYMYIKQSKKPLLANDIHKAVAPTSPRRTIEKRLLDLSNDGSIKRERCVCGCSYIYTK